MTKKSRRAGWVFVLLCLIVACILAVWLWHQFVASIALY